MIPLLLTMAVTLEKCKGNIFAKAATLYSKCFVAANINFRILHIHSLWRYTIFHVTYFCIEPKDKQ